MVEQRNGCLVPCVHRNKKYPQMLILFHTPKSGGTIARLSVEGTQRSLNIQAGSTYDRPSPRKESYPVVTVWRKNPDFCRGTE